MYTYLYFVLITWYYKSKLFCHRVCLLFVITLLYVSMVGHRHMHGLRYVDFWYVCKLLYIKGKGS